MAEEAEKKSIQDWENETNQMVTDLDKTPVTKLVTFDEFMAMGVTGVTIKDRKEFLESRGVPVTRANMLDHEAGSPLNPPEESEE